MKIKSNYQDVLKIIALIVMVIDHLGLYIFPNIGVMRAIGRFAMPVFCFFAGYNFRGTPRFRLLIYGALLYAFSTAFIFEQFITTNILISIFFGQIYLWLFAKKMNSFESSYIHLVILGVLWTVTNRLMDYGTLAAAIMVAGYMAQAGFASINTTAAITACLSLLHTATVFFNFLGNTSALVATLSSMAVYLALTMTNFKKAINCNLTVISRHTAIIYCLQYAVIETYWRYYL